jgi:hypothetical protein
MQFREIIDSNIKREVQKIRSAFCIGISDYIDGGEKDSDLLRRVYQEYVSRVNQINFEGESGDKAFMLECDARTHLLDRNIPLRRLA